MFRLLRCITDTQASDLSRGVLRNPLKAPLWPRTVVICLVESPQRTVNVLGKDCRRIKEKQQRSLKEKAYFRRQPCDVSRVYIGMDVKLLVVVI